jgi:diguanylate cyclase (GGDEF)-like protein/putative nucleotidyltransferase with HDIG domain
MSHRLQSWPLAAVTTLALIFLGAFAFWAAQTTRSSAKETSRSSRLSDAYQQARLAVAREATLEANFQLAPDTATPKQFRAQAAELEKALAVVRRLGDASDRHIAADIAASNRAGSLEMDLIARAVEHADAAAAATIDETQLRPRLQHIEARVGRAAAAHRARALEKLQASRGSETIVLAVLAVMMLLAGLAGWAMVVLQRYKRRLDDARQAEIGRLTEAAFSDHLTGLGNHRAFHEDLDRLLAADGGEEATLALLDLDGLKQANDAYGHQAGDELLVALATALRDRHGAGGTAYRIGGDEFALVLRDCRPVQALERILLSSAGVRTPRGLSVATAAGITALAPGTPKEELVRRADRALVEAKRRHRSALVYSPDLDAAPEPAETHDERHRAVLATALARAVDARDSYTKSHSETVSELCVAIAQELGFPAAHIEKIRFAGLLHDVGKIGISDAILRKPGPLTEEEYAVMQTHAQLGCHIVSATERYEEARWILHHHERIDGAGYPDALVAHQIPLESRIIAVADAYEAITSDRPYRRGRPLDVALHVLDEHAGTQFDPACVAALRRVLTGRGAAATPLLALVGTRAGAGEARAA